MRWDLGRQGGNIEDRRGLGPVHVGGGIGVLGLALAGYFFFGIDPSIILGLADQTQTVSQPAGTRGTPTDEEARFVDTILTNISDVWTVEFKKQGRTYEEPSPLVLYEGATGTQCGLGQSAMGPFYCPLDRRVYLDLTFYRELSDRFGAPGEFARAYVIAHEIGHHVQQLDGTGDKVRRAEQAAGSEAEANTYSVALELQADCYAGVWAAHASEVSGGKVAMEAGDLESGLKAAASIGDDTLQKQTQGRVVPDSFTHGSSVQRVTWLKRGYDSGNPKACDTFSETGAR